MTSPAPRQLRRAASIDMVPPSEKGLLLTSTGVAPRNVCGSHIAGSTSLTSRLQLNRVWAAPFSAAGPSSPAHVSRCASLCALAGAFTCAASPCTLPPPSTAVKLPSRSLGQPSVPRLVRYIHPRSHAARQSLPQARSRLCGRSGGRHAGTPAARSGMQRRVFCNGVCVQTCSRVTFVHFVRFCHVARMPLRPGFAEPGAQQPRRRRLPQRDPCRPPVAQCAPQAYCMAKASNRELR